MFPGLLILLVAVLLCSVGAYFAANAICQRRWKEKIPQSKLIGFTAIFVAVFVALGFAMLAASSVVFGR